MRRHRCRWRGRQWQGRRRQRRVSPCGCNQGVRRTCSGVWRGGLRAARWRWQRTCRRRNRRGQRRCHRRGLGGRHCGVGRRGRRRGRGRDQRRGGRGRTQERGKRAARRRSLGHRQACSGKTPIQPRARRMANPLPPSVTAAPTWYVRATAQCPGTCPHAAGVFGQATFSREHCFQRTLPCDGNGLGGAAAPHRLRRLARGAEQDSACAPVPQALLAFGQEQIESRPVRWRGPSER